VDGLFELMEHVADIVLLTENLHLVNKEQAWHYRVLPKAKSEKSLVLFCDENAQLGNLQAELEIVLGQAITLDPISAIDISRLLSKYYLKENASASPAQLIISTMKMTFW